MADLIFNAGSAGIVIAGAFARVVNSFVDVLDTFAGAFQNFFSIILAFLVYLKANRNFFYLVVAAIVLGFGSLGVYFFTEDALNVVNIFWTCFLRPTAEFFLKFFIHLVRFFYESITLIWNVIIRYLWDECLTVLYNDVLDWFDAFLAVADGAVGRFNDSASIGGLFSLVFDIARLPSLFYELPLIVYYAFECALFFWTEARPTWAVPVRVELSSSWPIPAYFPLDELTPFPTAAPINFPTPMPTPAAPPTPAPTAASTDQIFGTFPFKDVLQQPQFAYEFNPRYGAFSTFFGDTGVSNYIRRVLVSIQVFLANVAKTLIIYLRLYNTPLKEDLWASLIVDVNSSQSLWRMAADAAASGFGIIVTVFSPSEPACPQFIQSPSGQFSNYRFSIERWLYGLFRTAANFFRVISVAVYNALTQTVGGAPLYDFIQFPIITGVVRLNTNLFSRELAFCRMHNYVRENNPANFPEITNCPIWKGLGTPICQEWDGIDAEAYFTNANLKVPHLRLAVDAIIDAIQVLVEFGAIFTNINCDPSPFEDITNSFGIIRLVVFIFSDVVSFVGYFALGLYCQIYSPSFVPFAWIVRVILFFGDYFLNQAYPSLLNEIVGDRKICVNGQNFITCTLSFLATTGGPFDLFYRLCILLDDYVFEGLQLIVEGIQVIFNAIDSVINPILVVVQDFINTFLGWLEGFVNEVAGAVSSIAGCVSNLFGILGDCSWDDVNIVKFNSITIPPLNLGGLVDPNDLEIILPCSFTSAAGEAAVDSKGFISIFKRKRGIPDHIELTASERAQATKSLWYDEESNKVNVRAFIEHVHGKKLEDGPKVDTESAFESRNTFDKDKRQAERREEKMQKAVDLLEKNAPSLRMAAWSSDARTYYRAIEHCFLGSSEPDAVPPQYDLCVDVQHSLLTNEASTMDNACIASRCSQLAYQCISEYNAEHARTLGNTKNYNFFQHSLFAKPFDLAFNYGTWLAEQTTCYNASHELRNPNIDASLQTAFAVGAFVFDSGKRAHYIATNFAGAYYECVDEARDAARAQAQTSEESIVQHYVRCLERPYVDEHSEAAWTAHAQGNLPAFGQYLDEQAVSGKFAARCNKLLRENGVLFDAELHEQRSLFTAPQSSDEFLYRMCAYMHAFGTRSTLSTHTLLNTQGKKIVSGGERARMWQPRPDRNVENFLVWWKAPYSVMQSADMLGTPFYDLYNAGMARAGIILTNMIETLRRLQPLFTRMLRAFLNKYYVDLAAGVRLFDYWADAWDEIINPRDNLDRLLGRSAKKFIPAENRDDLLNTWYYDMRADVDRLLGKGLKEDERLHVREQDITYRKFRASGVELRRKRAEDIFVQDEGAAYVETVDDVDVNTIHLDVKPGSTAAQELQDSISRGPIGFRRVRRQDESAGDLLRRFVQVQHERLELQLDYGRKRGDAVVPPEHVERRKRDAVIREQSTKHLFGANFDVHDVNVLFAGNASFVHPHRAVMREKTFMVHNKETKTPAFEVQYVAKRSTYQSDKVTIALRMVQSQLAREQQRGSYTNNSLAEATWNYEPFSHIQLNVLVDALQQFIANTTDLTLDSIEDAHSALQLLTEIRGEPDWFKNNTAMVQQIQNLTQIAESKRYHALPSAYELTTARHKLFKPIQSGSVTRALNAIARIVDRRWRIADLPMVQGASMLVHAVASNDASLIAGWMSGDLGYVNGIGFLPRYNYELYMHDLSDDREKWNAPFMQPMIGAATSGTVSTVRTPWFLPNYDHMLRMRKKTEALRKQMFVRMHTRYVNVRRERHYKERTRMLQRYGHFEHDLHHGNNRTYHMHRRLAPHVHDQRWSYHKVDTERLQRLMARTHFKQRTAEQHEFVARAVAVASLSSSSSLPSLEDLFFWVDYVIELLGGPEDVTRNFFELVVDGVGTALGLLLDWEVSMAIGDWLDSFVCVVPDDFAKDGTGSYGLGCLLQGYLPERLFANFGVWPTDAHNGDFRVPDDLYDPTGGTPTEQRQCVTGFDFRPEVYCPDYIPIYESWYEADFCLATRDGSGESRYCNSFVPAQQASMPFCPTCEYCPKQYIDCEEAGFGNDWLRVLQVYTYQVGLVWDDIIAVDEPIFQIFLFVAITAFVFSFGFGSIFAAFFDALFNILLALFTLNIFAVPGAVLSLIKALILPLLWVLYISLNVNFIFIDFQPWIYGAYFATALYFLYEPALYVYFFYMAFRRVWFLNYDLFEDIFDDMTLGPDPFAIPYIDPVQLVGDVLRLIGDIPIPFFSASATLGTYLPFLYDWANDLQLFSGGVQPGDVEQFCSDAGGWWSVLLGIVGGFFVGYGFYTVLIVGAAIVSFLFSVGVLGLSIVFYPLFLVFAAFIALLLASGVLSGAASQIRALRQEMLERFAYHTAVEEDLQTQIAQKKTAPTSQYQEIPAEPAKNPPPVQQESTTTFAEAMFGGGGGGNNELRKRAKPRVSAVDTDDNLDV